MSREPLRVTATASTPLRRTPDPAKPDPPRRSPLLSTGWALFPLGLELFVLLADRYDALGRFFLAHALMFVAFKVVSLVRGWADPTRRLTWGRLLAYLFWFGLRPEPFRPQARCEAQGAATVFKAALFNLAVGSCLLWSLRTPS